MNKLTYARRLAVQDAIFWGQISNLKKQEIISQLQPSSSLAQINSPYVAQLTANYLEALQVLRKQLGRDLTSRKASLLMSGEMQVDDLYAGKVGK
jgi:hypothetical protein